MVMIAGKVLSKLERYIPTSTCVCRNSAHRVEEKIFEIELSLALILEISECDPVYEEKSCLKINGSLRDSVKSKGGSTK